MITGFVPIANEQVLYRSKFLYELEDLRSCGITNQQYHSCKAPKVIRKNDKTPFFAQINNTNR